MQEKWIAHIRPGPDGSGTTQSVAEHCRNAALYAQTALTPAGLGRAAYLAGLYHDAGKYTDAFQAYLSAAAAGKPVQRGSVIHSFTGTRYILETFHAPSSAPYERITAELIAYAIGAHHGLFDCMSPEGRSGFEHRLTHPDPEYEQSVHEITPKPENALFSEATQEISAAIGKLCVLNPEDQPPELSFYFGLLARMLVSAVMEGDRRDTAEFIEGVRRGIAPPPDWAGRLHHLEDKLRRFPADTPLARARQQISQTCREVALEPGGVYRLNVPTGGGKTLSSLGFALAHAEKWKKSRIIFTAPLLSILEQNAAVLREFIGDDDMVLEHHSNAVHETPQGDELDPSELLAENWSAPVIITTLVQLLNTLFSGKVSLSDAFQALCNSIIVIDEVQTVPAKMLSLFNLAVNFLSVVCNATIVLCSATQPCLEETCHGIRVPLTDIVPYSEDLWIPFRRTELVDAGTRKLEDIPDFAREILDRTDSLLIICNKKDEARQLSQALADLNCFHLSASMCPAHRRDTLSRIQNCLGKEKVVCISTQVMEAGVDISFGCVIRLTAGMDSAVQAAGRCNRNGESKAPLPVYLLNCSNENLGRLPEILRAKTASTALLDRFRRDPRRYNSDLSGDSAIRDYYRYLFTEMPKGYQDFTVKKGAPTLYSLMSDNLSVYREDSPFLLQQAFCTAGKLFQVFDADTVSVLVPYGDGRAVIERLRSGQAISQALLKQARPCLVNVYQYQFEALEAAQALGCDPEGRIFWLEDGWYDETVGLLTERTENPFLEV